MKTKELISLNFNPKKKELSDLEDKELLQELSYRMEEGHYKYCKGLLLRFKERFISYKDNRWFTVMLKTVNRRDFTDYGSNLWFNFIIFVKTFVCR